MKNARTSKLKVFLTLVCLCAASVLIYSCGQSGGLGVGGKVIIMGAGN